MSPLNCDETGSPQRSGEVIELSQKEFRRMNVIENAVAGRITVVEASGLPGLSRRQVYRLKAR
jgi:hypothetical protein